ncbi:MAG: helix-turn-helix domain-containing protein [Bacteroidales bacterium]
MHYMFIALLLPLLVALFWFVELLFSSGENSKAKKHLAFFMLCGFFSLLGGYIYFTGLYKFYTLNYFVIKAFSFAQLPAFYLYLKSLIKPGIKRQTYAKHYFIPSLAGLVAIFFHWIFLSLEESVRMFEFFTTPEVLSSKEKLAFYFDISFRNIFVLMAVFYLAVIHRQVKVSFKKLLNLCADAESKNPSWISIANLLYIIFSVFALLLFNLHDIFFSHFSDTYLILPLLVLATLFFLIGFKGNRQEMIVLISDVEEIPYSGPLPEDVKAYLRKNLEKAIEYDQLYLKQDICLPELAKHIGTNRYYLSKLINSEFEMNFNDFINRYRIREAMSLIQTNQNDCSLSEIATKSGFKSYISFSRNFKRQVNVSPEAYLRRQFTGKKE